ncbi:MAG TPA: VOC family protein [Victivallales bacterium]|nr:VOC family protein [Victivallales bacterium]
MKINFIKLSHINIIVDDIENGANYYKKLFNAEENIEFPHFKNTGFSKSAGFMLKPNQVDVTIRFLSIPSANITLELMQYFNPIGINSKKEKKTNDIGFGHISLNISNIEEAFEYICKNDIKLISSDSNYCPFKIDDITNDEFYFFDNKLENSVTEKDKLRKLISNTRYFYFIDKYGIQWELEQN